MTRRHAQDQTRWLATLALGAVVVACLVAAVTALTEGAGRPAGPLPVVTTSPSPYVCQTQPCTPLSSPIWEGNPYATQKIRP